MPNIKYNSERLNSVIKDFCIITDISVEVLDSEFACLASYSENKSEFCMEIQKTTCGKEKCICSDLTLLKKCRESRRVEWHICHAGILDAVVPIIKFDNIIGYIVIGRTRVLKFDEVYRRIDWMKPDYKMMESYYMNIKEYNEKQIKSMFELAVMIVSYILTNEIITPELDPFSVRAAEYIDGHLKENLTVQTLCRELNVSKNYLYEKFRTSFNQTVNDYIVSCRMRRASYLLKNTDLSVSRIAEEIGIGTYTYFSRLFKEKYNIPPLAYRKFYKALPQQNI